MISVESNDRRIIKGQMSVILMYLDIPFSIKWEVFVLFKFEKNN